MEAVSGSIRRARPLLGTFVEIAAAGDSRDVLEAAVEAAFAAVAAVHRLMTFHEPSSDVSRLNRDAACRAVRVHDWTYEVLETACDLHRRSGGVFDASIAPVLVRLGLLPALSSPSPRLPSGRLRPGVDALMASGEREQTVRGSAIQAPHGEPSQATQGGPSGGIGEPVQLLPGNRVRFAYSTVTIDLGGIAKGFAVDRAVEALQRHGIAEGLVNAGGDLRVFGPRSHIIDIRDPRQPERAIFHVTLRNAALASSAGRFDPACSHRPLLTAVIDPMTAQPAQAVRGATVRAPCCMIADALTKVVMNAGEAAAALLEHYSADALFVSAGGDAHMTAHWKNEVHLAA